ncbi:hypothetical protein JCM17846_29610 [Iodidimonas nitroreducens]|uniref:Uncharacterized protein n=1 Tax=Iodidimonas nitroreducens TaxID=1236968 RepID=A0A5A7NDZ5_9PROT|nr:hypothetical protein [Iodidimonas nitroreducens]GAK33862.1 hypothetical protein AQ1_01754 [alpha proteobacterium Q-1]GER05279.1 hypothetical protein JCM17846_29610 [Iodidimonas nitroreducens]
MPDPKSNSKLNLQPDTLSLYLLRLRAAFEKLDEAQLERLVNLAEQAGLLLEMRDHGSFAGETAKSLLARMQYDHHDRARV